MSLEVKLQVFEGPLDLLMHLIDKNKIDIYDIPIVTITEQYMDYINAMQRDDMEVTSEFLVMAATLIDIKCKMLLPKEVNEDGEEEDPRAELVEKLLEYKMYKFMADELKDRQQEADMQWFRSRNIPKEVSEYEAPIDFSDLIGDATLSKLNSIFQELLKRQEDKVDPIRSRFGNIEKEEIDMDAKTLYIKAYIREHDRFSFRQLLEKQHSKTEIIVTFLVMLEEMKLGEIEIEQDETFGDIIIKSRKAS
ncbi:MAG: segregation/condensation protein A [Butyrivibrio sp.]|jgi:segregation and condensation protein A|uniref:Segregation and condensation protein A n=1 Tax=Butyrivibrio hungatei TaxID=185008 RepID=A0A1G5C2Q8_9FIRM|nr:segregation/condensation protein A [Butyrivibrio hungatei]MBQ2608846.1 segregation/condensation protein A [Butyrivibrio sp.]MBQ4218520.1 segregation/condensation protein A [Butyrivibrio sp.]MBR4639088.1 segregation/condensation protein A [Butyrivibrio sp.]MEE3471794.1 segregation/condensation protein A [Butyrivibrio hungatei]SCX96616.1 condensin subunit ScpA [Butyrivibrio hungatei]